ncbi:MAG TPA: signal recognition particle-docking protein FtsY [Anaeromyxobacter sp.]
MPQSVALPLAIAFSDLTVNDAIGIAIVVLLALLVLAAAIRLARRHRGPPGPEVPSGEIERELEREATELPPETVARAGPPSARAAVPPPPPPAPPPAREEARAAREAEEERKREEYRRKKEADRLDRERRRQEREAEEARARAEAERALREAEEARRREEEERRRRAEAEAGKTLAAGLEKTRGGFMARINALFAGGTVVDDAVLADLEEVLFTADIGVKTATKLLETARERVKRKELSDPAKLKAALREEVARILALDGAAPDAPLRIGAARPWVVMVVGVNGSGKTTTVGKLAAKLKAAGHSVLLGAGDTFRAAAGEQLEIWAERVGAPVVRGKEGADPASVCFEAAQRGAAEKVDVVLCDTAGRLHTKVPLMEELKKVKRVLAKAAEGAPHEVLLVLDATNGQNAIAQARQFNEALGVTGIALTKLDGTAKGGVVIGICDELRIPVRYVGVGETVADLKPFVPREFVEALFA